MNLVKKSHKYGFCSGGCLYNGNRGGGQRF